MAYAPPATASEAAVEHRLLRRYRDGDLGAREELVVHFAPLARRLAGRYRRTSEPQEDLEQVAYLGLLKAIDRYDADLGPFVRCAVPNVLGELRCHFRDRGWAIHVSRTVQVGLLEVNKAMETLPGRLGRSPTTADIADHTSMSVEQVAEAMEAGTAYAPKVLDTIGGDEGRFELIDLGAAVAPALLALPQRERTILALRFQEDLSQSEIAERVGVSQMHVSRLLRRALDRLGDAANGALA